MKYLIGIQPTGKVTLGNYMGCLAKGLRLQDEGHDVTFLLANYHSMTTDSYTDVTEVELVRLGCRNIVRQTPAYTELFFRLCCRMNLGTLQKMPQYKDKSGAAEYDLGLLLYPVLMAADIIMNDPDVVIVGRDQVAHMDLANDIAKRVGVEKRFEYEMGDAEKVMSLVDPGIKMSKSSGDAHVLYLFDEDYAAKLRRANTNEAGLANLRKIGDFLGAERCDMNSEYKERIAARMASLFAH
jgi:tryptophanyl-tRNA synthetase